jgi:hypothetical protein
MYERDREKSRVEKRDRQGSERREEGCRDGAEIQT